MDDDDASGARNSQQSGADRRRFPKEVVAVVGISLSLSFSLSLCDQPCGRLGQSLEILRINTFVNCWQSTLDRFPLS